MGEGEARGRGWWVRGRPRGRYLWRVWEEGSGGGGREKGGKNMSVMRDDLAQKRSTIRDDVADENVQIFVEKIEGRGRVGPAGVPLPLPTVRRRDGHVLVLGGGLACLDVRDPPLTRRISRRAKGAPEVAIHVRVGVPGCEQPGTSRRNVNRRICGTHLDRQLHDFLHFLLFDFGRLGA